MKILNFTRIKFYSIQYRLSACKLKTLHGRIHWLQDYKDIAPLQGNYSEAPPSKRLTQIWVVEGIGASGFWEVIELSKVRAAPDSGTVHKAWFFLVEEAQK